MFANFKYMHDERIPTPNYACVCFLIYEVVVKVDNVIVRTNPPRIRTLAPTLHVCTVLTEAILSFRSPYFVDYTLNCVPTRCIIWISIGMCTPINICHSEVFATNISLSWMFS